jgi:hypothetical protein
MCVEEISGSEQGSGWESDIGESESTFAELNGCKRQLTVLPDDTRVMSIYEKATYERFLQNQAVIEKSLQAVRINPMEAGGDVHLKVEFKWDKDEGVTWKGGAGFERHDDKGNYVEIDVNIDHNGQGGASVETGHHHHENRD